MGFRDSDNIIEPVDNGNVFDLAEPIDDGNVFDTDTGATAISSTSEAAASAFAAANSAVSAAASAELALAGNIPLGNLKDVNTTGITDGQIIQYEAGTSTYVPHTLTTTSMTDIDNTNKTDGALLLFDETSNKYKATTQLNNANTYVIGGSF